MISLESKKFSNLEEIYKIVKQIDFDFIKPEQSFAIRALRVGEHDFTSIDIGRVAGQAVIDSYKESKGIRLKVNLDEPDVIIRTDVIHNELYVGIDTTGDDALHKRWYRVYNHPAPLNSAIASCMIRLANWNKNKSLFDPMCGGGTIPIEAALKERNIPIGKNREFAYFKLYGKILPYIEENREFMEIYGMDKFKKHVNGAIRNAESAGVKDTINFFQGDATLKKLEADIIITNPPYGLRIGSKRILKDLYSKFVENLFADKIVVITAEYKIFESFLENHYYDYYKIPVKYGNLDARIFVMGKLK